MFAYQYHSTTFEYLGKAVAYLDPMATKRTGKDVYTLPGNCTFSAPPEKKLGYAFVWNKDDSIWNQVEDHRGEKYYPAGSTYYSDPVTMTDLGPFPEGSSTNRPDKTLDEAKTEKNDEIKSEFNSAESKAYITSQLGFRADANERANRDINGLISVLEDMPEGSTVQFRDYDNQFHELGLTEMKTLQLEVIQNGQYLYQQKWAFEKQVETCTTVLQVEAIVVEYKMKDFTEN